MSETFNNTGMHHVALDPEDPLNRRLLRTMALFVLISVLISLPFARWRVSGGLLMGGTLSLLNYRWMRNSIAAAFARAEDGLQLRIRLAQYLLRYLVIGGLVFGAYQLHLISLPATVVGLSSFVVALFVEAFREFCSMILHREGIS